MSIKDKLQIYLITYNRKEKFKRTLDFIFDNNSPIKDFDIVILDNASTDGTSELIEEYRQNHQNIAHIKHPVNIGGNPNICRAFEMGASCNKEYFWVLCDDDYFDFSHWSEVENEIEKGTDIICLSNYVFENSEQFEDKAYQLYQLTFVPAGIYKSNLVSNDVLMNMYDSIYTMFQQICPVAECINKQGKITVLKNQVMINGIFVDTITTEEVSLIRGQDEKNILERRKDTSWILGWSNIISLLKDKQLINHCMEIIPFSDKVGYGTMHKFVDHLFLLGYLKLNKLHYIFELLTKFGLKLRLEVFLRILTLYIARFWRTETGTYVCLFNTLKMKILPF
ncbi:MAG: glycosyltransferase family 2 protein [Candidatus Gastranaerophilaceae bacterium]